MSEEEEVQAGKWRRCGDGPRDLQAHLLPAMAEPAVLLIPTQPHRRRTSSSYLCCLSLISYHQAGPESTSHGRSLFLLLLRPAPVQRIHPFPLVAPARRSCPLEPRQRFRFPWRKCSFFVIATRPTLSLITHLFSCSDCNHVSSSQ